MKTLIKLFFVVAVIFGDLNFASAQSSKTQKQAAKAAAIKKMVTDVNYVFKANYVNPQRGGNRALTDDYDLVVSQDTIIAFLPYFGRAYVAPTDPTEGGIKFKSTNFEYKVKENKKGGWDVLIKPKDHNISDMRDIQSLRLGISSSGYASLSIISTNRDPISFEGTIEERGGKR